jgi:hypothetical protein
MCAECERLRDRIEELEDVLGMNLEPAWGAPNLGPLCWQLVGMLVRRPSTREGLHAALYGGLPESDQPDVAMISTHVSRLNKFLRTIGAEISGRRGYGRYWMSDASKAAYKKFVQARETRLEVADISLAGELVVGVPGRPPVLHGAVAPGDGDRRAGLRGHDAPREAAPGRGAKPLRDRGPGDQVRAA